MPPPTFEDVGSFEGPSDWDEVLSRGKISRDEHYQWMRLDGSYGGEADADDDRMNESSPD
ncbi:hypothetical protein BVRB_008950 [Beta vulgaris subsp. vulgaris]|uniref:Uncharacterized protein n=1 Tax=Beta vulgaris subsp. vulgaris TaxID=3555 RepID=A0A0J8B6F0_BETVV|nr:hypothetical protein BVRB_008950 [Beta vulgaris subsp. vulgaris]